MYIVYMCKVHSHSLCIVYVSILTDETVLTPHYHQISYLAGLGTDNNSNHQLNCSGSEDTQVQNEKTVHVIHQLVGRRCFAST